MEDKYKRNIEKLKYASPLQVTQLLSEMEMYDKKEAQKIIDEVYCEFESGEAKADAIVKPVFLSVVDRIMANSSVGKKMNSKGLTPSRILNECENFDYDGKVQILSADAHVENKNTQDRIEILSAKEAAKKGEYSKEKRKLIEDKKKMKKYKNDQFGSNKIIKDEYGSNQTMYKERKNPDKRRNDKHFENQAETDHIVPLENIYSSLKSNIALTENDIKEIANDEYNLALTNQTTNRAKGKLTNEEYIEKHPELSEEQKKTLRQKGKEAQRGIEKTGNKTIGKNLVGNEERSKELRKTLSKEAGKQAADNAVGDVVVFIIKPLYFEMKDSFKNGFIEGVNASTFKEAMSIRFKRIKEYVISHSAEFFGSSVLEFIKAFISSLIEAIIGLFLGVFKQMLKIAKEGLALFVKSMQILFGEGSENRTAAEKGDAIVKLVGGTVVALAGVGIEALLNKLGIPDPWSVVLSTILGGVASTLFMFLFDKIDLFSVKAEKRHQRIKEIFDERIKDIEEARNSMNVIAIETLRKQRKQFDEANAKIDKAIEENDIDKINGELYHLADFMEVDLAYSNLDEFVDYLESDRVVML